MKKTEQPIYNRVLSNVCRITCEADSFSVSPSECHYGTSARPRLEVVKSSKTCCFSLFFVIRNAVPSGHIVTSLANHDIVMLTFRTCIRKVLICKQGWDFSYHWSSTHSRLQAIAGVVIRLGDDRFLTNFLKFIIHQLSNLRRCMVWILCFSDNYFRWKTEMLYLRVEFMNGWTFELP